MNIVHYIESKGFKVRGKRIFKQNGKAIGQVNENNFYIFAHNNIYPFKSGINYIENKTLTNGKRLKNTSGPAEPKVNKVKFGEDSACGSSLHSEPMLKRKPTKDNPEISNKFPVDKKDYIGVTSTNSVFNTYLDDLTNTHLGKDAENYFDLRGVEEGYLKGAVVFPIYKANGDFYTGHIIKYKNNGKRVKQGASINWFHTYKDIVKNLFNCNPDTDKHKYSLSQTHFFGEHQLLGSDNPVAIVEAPKTASIMKEFYPNIDWIATIGISGLNSKNLEMLRTKNVMIFPDSGSSDWDGIADVYGWSRFNVLDDYLTEEGSDIVDYFFDLDFNGYNAIRNILDEVSEGTFDFEADRYKDGLSFSLVDEKYLNSEYFTMLTRNRDIVWYKDNSKDYSVAFNGANFNFYTEKYKVYNAQIDWHSKNVTDEKFPTFFSEDDFKYNLKKCYVLLKTFNPDGEYLEMYENGLRRLNRLSNFRFSVNYVLANMVDVWDNEDIDVKDYVKLRDWKYISSEQITKTEFVTRLNNDRFRYKLNLRLLGFSDAIKENRFIDYETDLGLSANQGSKGYDKLMKMVKQWNEEVIGAKTYKTWLIKNDFESKLYEHFNSGTEIYPPHIENIYIVGKKVYQDYSYSKITEITGVTNKNTIKKFKSFKANADTRTLIEKDVNLMIDNIKLATPLRETNSKGKVRITTFESVKIASKDMTPYNTSLADAFGLPDGDNVRMNSTDLMDYAILDCTVTDAPDNLSEDFLKYELERLIKIKNDNKLFNLAPVTTENLELFSNNANYVYK